MLNFRENFFFVKFSVLFFLVIIFGYWGIDLNSEELYIAFSFLFLVVLTFVISRQALLLVFVKSVNAKFTRLVADLFVIVSSLTLQLKWLLILQGYFKFLSAGVFYFCASVIELLGKDSIAFEALILSRINAISLYTALSVGVFAKKMAQARSMSVVRGGFARFFTINF